ncbi:sugar transferase, partial [Patescibacteria group bacterium]|nr:sugar transferase [Patescibacteria group bacterium]MBU1613192.1 sugar transferase [Patescibacteria group bacterium]
RLLKMIFHRFGLGLRRTAIIGNQIIANQIRETLLNRPSLGYSLLGVYEHFDEKTEKNLSQKKVDEIIFTDPKSDEEGALRAIDFANERDITFKYSADIFATISSNMAISAVAGIPIIELGRTRLTGWGKIFKRLADIFGSLFLIIIISPIFLLVALVILFETGRPIIYKNERVGAVGKKFFAYKFRSLYQKYCTGEQFGKEGELALEKESELIKKQNAKNGPVYKIKNDPRITPFGRFIRKWSLDELPQFFNVLRGEMSLVGPRPHQPREVEQYQKWHRTVLAVKPGITGLAQISGRSDLTFDEEARLDILYLERWNIIQDLIIITKTPFVILLSKGAW